MTRAQTAKAIRFSFDFATPKDVETAPYYWVVDDRNGHTCGPFFLDEARKAKKQLHDFIPKSCGTPFFIADIKGNVTE